MKNLNDLLVEFYKRQTAKDFGVKQEQLTSEFIKRIRKKMYTDIQFGKKIKIGSSEEIQWREKCLVWAQEVLKELQTIRPA
jgi:hypothetical protein